MAGPPPALSEARLIDGLCQRWGSPPSVILEQSSDLVFQMLAILEAAGDFEREAESNNEARASGPPPAADPLEQQLAEAMVYGDQ